ncbi:MAG: coproporphyrinogen dehydrogenase, partial [Negativicutes bacterium]
MRYGVYVHIPFCRKKCAYCDFPSQVGTKTAMADYTAALCREMRARGPEIAVHGPAATAYI